MYNNMMFTFDGMDDSVAKSPPRPAKGHELHSGAKSFHMGDDHCPHRGRT